ERGAKRPWPPRWRRQMADPDDLAPSARADHPRGKKDWLCPVQGTIKKKFGVVKRRQLLKRGETRRKISLAVPQRQVAIFAMDVADWLPATVSEHCEVHRRGGSAFPRQRVNRSEAA